MNKVFINAKIFYHGSLELMQFKVGHKKFIEISKHIEIDENDQVIDLNHALVTPGLFDIHTHGALGYDFNMATFEQMKIIMDYYLTNGVTSVFPTVMTDSVDNIIRQLKLIAKLQPLYPSIKGIHLEGPHLSMKYKGAQPPENIIDASVEIFKTFNQAANQLIKYTTIAPEVPGAFDLISYAKEHQIQVTLGHSDADFETTLKALDLGANSFTHLGNAMRPLNHHEPGILGAALYSDAYTEMILDGMHLSPEMVKLLTKVRDYKKLIIITDSIMAAGLSDGNYYLGTHKIYVKNGDARLVSNNTRAGSTLNPFQAVLNYSKFTNIPFEQAVELMSINPANLMQLNDKIGSISFGKDADFLVIENNQLKSVYAQGKLISS